MMDLQTFIPHGNRLLAKFGLPPIPRTVSPEEFNVLWEQAAQTIVALDLRPRGRVSAPPSGPQGMPAELSAMPSGVVTPVNDPLRPDGLRESEWRESCRVWGHTPDDQTDPQPFELSSTNRVRRSRAQIDAPLTDEDIAEARKLWGFKPKN